MALFAGLLALLVASVATAAPRPKLSKDLTDAVAAGHGGDVIFQADRATVGLARASGAFACLDLPCDPADLRFVLDRLAARIGSTTRDRSDGPSGAVPPPMARGRVRPTARTVADRGPDA